MKLGIAAKLFVAILATNLATIVAVGLAVHGSFDRGFRSYVREREARRIDTLDRALVNAYAENGDWSFLRDNADLWSALNRPRFDGHGFDGPPGFPRGGPLPDGRLEREDGNPRARDSGDARVDRELPREGVPPGPPSAGEGGFPSRDRPSGHVDGSGSEGRRFGPPPGILYDKARKVVAGEPPATKDTEERPIVVGGETVGWLVTSTVPPPFDRIDVRFRDAQVTAVWLIGMLAMLVAAGVAWALSRRLLAPVKHLAAATHRLASGEYVTRVESYSGDELGTLLADFNRLAQTLEHNERLRREFMADVSHELRTPLAVLRGELEALQDGVRRATPETVVSLQAEVATLSKLVDDLYDLALADVGALTYRFERLDVAAALESALSAFAQRLKDRDLTLRASLPATRVMLDADAQRLTQLFNNLLENSVRHTDPGGTVEVTLSVDDEDALIQIQDSAPSVPEEAMGRIFDRLYRGEPSRSREYGGAGLGLAICRNIVEAHRGEIAASPSPLGGVRIRVRLPTTEAP